MTDTDLLPCLGETNLEDHYRSHPDESAAFPSEGLDPVDEPPMIMGHDGDDLGQLTKIKLRPDDNPEWALAALVPGDLMQAGHGFMVRDIGTPPVTEWRTTCELCGVMLLPPADEWVCELGHEVGGPEWAECGCNWCLIRGQWLRGEYRPKGGRPAQRCGTTECKRAAARERQRKSRAARKELSQKPH